MPIGKQKPRGLLRLGFRLPILLYHLHLGWLLGKRFLLLTHTGRKSGLPRKTVIEVIGHDRLTDTYFVVSGFGKQTDWFLNLRKHPNARVTVGRRDIPVLARPLPEKEGARVLMEYATLHPIAFKELSTLLTGRSIVPTEADCLEFVESMPVVAFEPCT